VSSFIAEGFNVDPDTGRGVYQGAFTRNDNGLVLAINGIAAEHEQFLTPEPMWRRSRSTDSCPDLQATRSSST
jgi:hypothetical protein